jgi:hypothetical protein
LPGRTGEFIHRFVSLHGQDARAHVRVWRQDANGQFDPTGEYLLVIVTAITGQAAMQLAVGAAEREEIISIQPAAEQIAAAMCEAYRVNPYNLVYVEHWSPRGTFLGGRWQFHEDWYRVHMTYTPTRGFKAQGQRSWEPITRADVETLIGGPWEEPLGH